MIIRRPGWFEPGYFEEGYAEEETVQILDDSLLPEGFEAVAFPQPDAEGTMRERTLLQFRRSPVFQQLLAAFASEVQELLLAVEGVLRLRTPQAAAGEQLNALGRIVGQARGLVDFSLITWFTPDTELAGPDAVPIWVTDAPLGGNLTADDAFYRQLIEAKVKRNHCGAGSVAEVQNVARSLLGVEVGVLLLAPMRIALVVPDNTSDNVMHFLRRTTTNAQVDSTYVLPIPAGVGVEEVVRYSDVAGSS